MLWLTLWICAGQTQTAHYSCRAWRETFSCSSVDVCRTSLQWLSPYWNKESVRFLQIQPAKVWNPVSWWICLSRLLLLSSKTLWLPHLVTKDRIELYCSDCGEIQFVKHLTKQYELQKKSSSQKGKRKGNRQESVHKSKFLHRASTVGFNGLFSSLSRPRKGKLTNRHLNNNIMAELCLLVLYHRLSHQVRDATVVPTGHLDPVCRYGWLQWLMFISWWVTTRMIH